MMLSKFWEEWSVFDFWCGVRECRTGFFVPIFMEEVVKGEGGVD